MNNNEKCQLITKTLNGLIDKLTPEDGVLKSRAETLTNQLQPECTNFQATIDGLVGFIQWSTEHNVADNTVLTTIVHDLIEFANNRDEPWYCPRSYDYAQYVKP